MFFVILGLAATAIVEGRVSLFSRSRQMRQRLDELRGHFVVCASAGSAGPSPGGTGGRRCAFVVVHSKAELEPDLERDGRCYLIGDASDEAVLREAGIERAQGLICAVDSDAENAFITIVARSLSPDLLIVARGAREQSADRCTERALPMWSRPYVTSGRRMANLAVRPHVVEFFDLARAGQPDLRLEELAITEGSPLAGPEPAGAERACGAIAGPPPRRAADRQPSPQAPATAGRRASNLW